MKPRITMYLSHGRQVLSRRGAFLNKSFPLKRAFLYSLIVSVVLSAGLGIVAILVGKFGWFETRVMLTAATVALASICGLACGAYLATHSSRIIPYAGIAITLAAAAMIIFGMWTESRSELLWKLAASCSVFAVACGHLSLLSMARLAEGFQWSLKVAYVVILGVATLIVVIIFGEVDESSMFRLLAVAAIVDAAMTIVVPIFHRLSRADLAARKDSMGGVGHAAIDAEIQQLRQRIAELERRKIASG